MLNIKMISIHLLCLEIFLYDVKIIISNEMQLYYIIMF